MIRIQSTDTFQKSCKKPSTGQKAGLRGRTADNVSFSHKVQTDTFEGSRMPEPMTVKTPLKDKVKTGSLLAFGLAATAAGFAMKR